MTIAAAARSAARAFACRLRGALLGASAAAALAVLPAAEAEAFDVPSLGLKVGVTPAIASDYLFRGISQTRNNWAYQGTLDIQHESGVYVGAFLSNAKFLANPYNDARQELDLLAGYRFELAGVSLDVGYIAYLYPGQDKAPGGQLNEFQEVGVRGSYTIDPVKLGLSFFYSPNFFGRSGDGYYVEGAADVTLPFGFTATGRLAHQWIERNPFFGTPDYLWYAVGLQREIFAGINVAVGFYGTDIRKRDCAPVVERAERGQRICGERVLFTISRAF